MAVTGEGVWTAAIYKPFYFNLDFFFTGMLLNSLKNDRGEEGAGTTKQKEKSFICARFVYADFCKFVYLL